MATKFGRDRTRDEKRGVYLRLTDGEAHRARGFPVRYLILYGLLAVTILGGLASRNVGTRPATVDVPGIVLSKNVAHADSPSTYTVRIRLSDGARAPEYTVAVDKAVWEAAEPGMKVHAAMRRGFRPMPVSLRLGNDETPATDETQPLFEPIPMQHDTGLPSASPVP